MKKVSTLAVVEGTCAAVAGAVGGGAPCLERGGRVGAGGAARDERDHRLTVMQSEITGLCPAEGGSTTSTGAAARHAPKGHKDMQMLVAALARHARHLSTRQPETVGATA
jgi:hypothetical protein